MEILIEFDDGKSGGTKRDEAGQEHQSGMRPPLTLQPLNGQENMFSFYEITLAQSPILCRAGWCTLVYFETFAEAEGIERSYCEPGNLIFLRNRECRISPVKGGKLWAVDFKKDFFEESTKNLIADCPFYYDFLNAEREAPEVLYYMAGKEDERKLAADLLKYQLMSDDQYTLKNVRIALALFLTIMHRFHFQDQCISASTMMTEYREGQILRYLSEHYATATLKSTAEAFNYHPNYFSSLFHKLFRCEFSSKLQQIRLERARYLLSTTDLTVEQVRAAVGFSEKSYFYRIFREKYKTTPAAFRRQVLNQRDVVIFS